MPRDLSRCIELKRLAFAFDGHVIRQAGAGEGNAPRRNDAAVAQYRVLRLGFQQAYAADHAGAAAEFAWASAIGPERAALDKKRHFILDGLSVVNGRQVAEIDVDECACTIGVGQAAVAPGRNLVIHEGTVAARIPTADGVGERAAGEIT